MSQESLLLFRVDLLMEAELLEPLQQLFSSLLGLEVSPRLAREASAFWRSISELSDISTRDKIWSGILPTQEELLNPPLYLTSVEVPDDLSGLL